MGQDRPDVRAEVADLVSAILKEFRLSIGETDLLPDGRLELDSIEAVALLIALERRFEIIIEDWEMAESIPKTLDDLAALVVKKAGGES